MDGECAGTRLGRFLYYIFDFRDLFDSSTVVTQYSTWNSEYFNYLKEESSTDE